MIPTSNMLNGLFTRIVRKAARSLPPHQMLSVIQSIADADSELPQKFSFAQCGEDLIVQYIFDARNVYKPSYLDVGAYHPYKLSNSALFYLRGSSGVNVEANPDKIALFIHARPRDVTVWGAMTDEARECLLEIPEEGDTLAHVKTDGATGSRTPAATTKKVPSVRLSDILQDHCAGEFPDFFSLDVEGFELPILEQIPFHVTKPKVICVETISYSTTGRGAKDENIARFLTNNGYLVYADTNVNTIFVLRDFWQIGEASC
jgi:FkbM family methyltransferase